MTLMSSPGSTYKAAHEEFVSNHSGSSLLEVMHVVTVLPALLIIANVVKGKSGFAFFKEYALVTLPQVLCLTVLSDSWAVGMFIYLTAAAAVVFKPSAGNDEVRTLHGTDGPPSLQDLATVPGSSEPLAQSTGSGPTGSFGGNHPHRVQCLTSYKGGNMLLTCIAILAVDFPVFPRKFAKTETFGVSLMDIGIGTFIASSAYTSQFARNVTDHSSEKINVLGLKFTAYSAQKFIVLLLGIGRAISLRVLDYHSHNSEYGTDWNFFVTLYLLWVLADISHLCLNRQELLLFSMLILIVYQYILVNTALTDYILYAPRNDLFSSNREGFCSLVGCLSLFLTCEYISHQIFFTPLPVSLESLKVEQSNIPVVSGISDKQIKKKWLMHLAFLSLSTLILWALADAYQPTSRRLFNLGFVLLCLFVSLFGISLMVSVELLCDFAGQIDAKVLELFNTHQLVVFFFANVLTGFVNMSVHTIYQDEITAISILCLYMLLIQSLAWLLNNSTINSMLSAILAFFLRSAVIITPSRSRSD